MTNLNIFFLAACSARLIHFPVNKTGVEILWHHVNVLWGAAFIVCSGFLQVVTLSSEIQLWDQSHRIVGILWAIWIKSDLNIEMAWFFSASASASVLMGKCLATWDKSWFMMCTIRLTPPETQMLWYKGWCRLSRCNQLQLCLGFPLLPLPARKKKSRPAMCCCPALLVIQCWSTVIKLCWKTPIKELAPSHIKRGVSKD